MFSKLSKDSKKTNVLLLVPILIALLAPTLIVIIAYLKH